MSQAIKFVELTGIDDDLLLPWLDLYEIAFPPDEKALVSSFLRLLKDKSRGLSRDEHMVAAVGEFGQFVGLMNYEERHEAGAGVLWYLAVTPETRDRGWGRACHQEVLRRVREAGLQAAIFEVEVPENCTDPEWEHFARRRIEFYRRQGALMLTGIVYIQTVGPHQPPKPLHLMVQPFEPMSPDDAFALAQAVFGDAVTKVGEPGLVPYTG